MTTYPTPQLPHPGTYGLTREHFAQCGVSTKKVIKVLEKKRYPVDIVRDLINKRRYAAQYNSNGKKVGRGLKCDGVWLIGALFDGRDFIPQPPVQPEPEVKVERKVIRTGSEWYEKKREIEQSGKPLPDGYLSASDVAKHMDDNTLKDYLSSP